MGSGEVLASGEIVSFGHQGRICEVLTPVGGRGEYVRQVSRALERHIAFARALAADVMAKTHVSLKVALKVDKSKLVERVAQKTETTAAKGDSKTLYAQVKRLQGWKPKPPP